MSRFIVSASAYEAKARERLADLATRGYHRHDEMHADAEEAAESGPRGHSRSVRTRALREHGSIPDGHDHSVERNGAPRSIDIATTPLEIDRRYAFDVDRLRRRMTTSSASAHASRASARFTPRQRMFDLISRPSTMIAGTIRYTMNLGSDPLRLRSLLLRTVVSHQDRSRRPPGLTLTRCSCACRSFQGARRNDVVGLLRLRTWVDLDQDDGFVSEALRFFGDAALGPSPRSGHRRPRAIAALAALLIRCRSSKGPRSSDNTQSVNLRNAQVQGGTGASLEVRS